jgi:hypothetical protein
MAAARSQTSMSSAPGRADLPAGTPSWVTAELLQQTQELWTKKSGISIGPDEALGIILRVSTLLDVLARR